MQWTNRNSSPQVLYMIVLNSQSGISLHANCVALSSLPLQIWCPVWPEPIWKRVKKHQITYPMGPESVSIEIPPPPPFSPPFLNFKKLFLLSKFRSERGDFNWCRPWASWVLTYFDAVVIEVKTFLPFRLALSYYTVWWEVVYINLRWIIQDELTLR